MSGVCSGCKCLDSLKNEIEVLRKLHEERDLFHGIELAKERKRIKRLEDDIIKCKNAVAQANVVKSTGSWGVNRKRAEIIYSRLQASVKNGMSFLTRGDVKMAIGVSNYSQATAAMEECVRIHKDVRLSLHRNFKVIEFVGSDVAADPVEFVSLPPVDKKQDYLRMPMVPELAKFSQAGGK